MKELPATLLLGPTGFETLATRLWSETSVGAYGAAAVPAAMLVMLAAVPDMGALPAARQGWGGGVTGKGPQLLTGTAVEVSGVTKSFGDVQALDGADLSVLPGTLVAVLGPSGCGKTTLLRAVAGFERIDGGTIAVGGHCVAGPGVHVPPEGRQVGIVPQDQALFPHLTVARTSGSGSTASRGGPNGSTPCSSWPA